MGRTRFLMNAMRFLQSFPILTLVFANVPSGAVGPQVPGSMQSVVRGRIEILNPKVKLRGGGTDASGVVVWLIPSKGVPKPESVVQPRGRLEQRDKRFVPHIMVIQVGTEIDFPNNDPFFHNVFSLFDGKTFDLGLYANGESRPVRFNRPGISYLYCNIHPQMSAVIVTVETPYFTISAPDGYFSIQNVPTGSYELRLWHERSDARQLAARSRPVLVESTVADLGIFQLDEAGYIPRTHKDKHGNEYDSERNQPVYQRP